MKIEVEPNRFRDFLSSLLVYRSKPLLPQISAEFKSKGVGVKDMTLEAIAVVGMFSPKYFISYEAEDETVVLTESLLDVVKKAFKGDKITVWTENNNIIIEGENYRYEEPIKAIEPQEFKAEIKMTDIGIIPTIPKFKVQVRIPVSELSLPTAEKYTLISDGNNLKISIEEVGKLTKTLKLSQVKKLEPVTTTVFANYLLNMVNNLSGEIWLSFDENVIVLSKKAKEYALSYFLATVEIIEEEGE